MVEVRILQEHKSAEFDIFEKPGVTYKVEVDARTTHTDVLV